MSLRTLVFLFTIPFVGRYSLGQSAQATSNALLRTFMIATTFGTGTTFSIDVDDREYWITAKHMFSGKTTGPAGVFTTKTVQAAILSQVSDADEAQDRHWLRETFTVLDPGKDIDILVLVPSHLLLPSVPRGFSLHFGSKGVSMGGECEFLGFPWWGAGWKTHMQNPKDPDGSDWMWLPYIKHCTPSGQFSERGITIWVLDGINNHGFSGGPVLFGTGAEQSVFAVISGFYGEPLDVLPAPNPGEKKTSSVPPSPNLPGPKSKRPKKEIVNANSGAILAFDIDPAIKAIRNNPIGPVRP